MDNQTILELVKEVFEQTEGNHLTVSETGRELTLFDAPLVAFSRASDPLFETFKEVDVIGPRYMTPLEWMPEAKSVISMVFPYTEEVRASARKCSGGPSLEWVYGRVEGHAFMQKCMRNLVQRLRELNVNCCIPTDDKRYTRYPREYQCGEEMNRHIEIVWSERHAGFVSGHGTFGLSRCLITKKGTAHRLISCIVDVPLDPTPRDYTEYMEYCDMCGSCIRRCPPKAISREYGKNNIICGDWNNELKERFYPRYGCSCCMTAVPCECQPPLPL